jgi:transposase
MDITQENIRVLVETCRRNAYSPGEAFTFITKAWGQDAIAMSTIYKLYKEYEEDTRTSFADAARSGRPCSSRTVDNINLVREFLDEDPHITVEELAEVTDLSHGTVQRILCDDLQMKSVIAKWVPHILTKEMKESRVREAKNILHFFQTYRRTIHHRLVVVDEKWLYHRSVGTKDVNRIWTSKMSDERPHVARRLSHDKKIMIIVAMTFHGKNHFEILDNKETVDGDRYLTFLKNMQHNFKRHHEKLTWDQMILLQDNARPHTKATVVSYLAKKGVILLKQPAYSPDFNLMDRFVFTRLEKNRRFQSFESKDEVKQFLTTQLCGISEDELKSQFQHLQEDLRLVIERGGDYL